MQGGRDGFLTRAGRVVTAASEAAGIGPSGVGGALVAYCAGCMTRVKTDLMAVAADIGDATGARPFLAARRTCRARFS